MFDEKIVMILFPFWLASVIATLYTGFVRPCAAKAVNTLLEKKGFDSERALSADAMGFGPWQEKLVLKRSLSQLVRTCEKNGVVCYYMPEEKSEKAAQLYGKKEQKPWMSVVFALGLTVFFVLMCMLASAVFDTSLLKPLFEF